MRVAVLQSIIIADSLLSQIGNSFGVVPGIDYNHGSPLFITSELMKCIAACFLK